MTQVLALYDIVGIQEYIFASKKMKENIGASNIIHKVFSEFLSIPQGSELIYSGGGNALVLFSDKKSALETTKQLSKRVMEETDGILKFVVAYQDKPDSFSNDMKILMGQLQKNKNSIIHTYPVAGISITREATTDRLPAYKCKDGDYLSYSAINKISNTQTERFNYLLPNQNYKFPLEFEDLGQVEGNSYISIVHIDGNSMGKFISESIKNIPDYNKAKESLKKYSTQVSEYYKDTMKKTVEHLYNNLDNIKDKFKIKDTIIPIRVIVLNGDDTTFICDGRLGLPLAEYFLKKLAECKIDEKSLYACAGVCIVKTAFPFYRAYKFAEELCSTAKQMARIDNRNFDEYHSWIDWQVIRSGIYTSINELRSNEYNIPALGEAIKQETIVDEREIVLKKSNLLLRPYKINDSESKQDFLRMLKVKDELAKIPRNKIKSLRNSLIKSKEEVEIMKEILESRNEKIPEYNYDTNLFPNNIFPYFDAMELIEFYQNLSEVKGN